MKEIIQGIFTWSWLSPKHGYNFNGYAVYREDGLILIDPAIMDQSVFRKLTELGNPEVILLTNKDHERIACELRSRLGAKIYINEKDSLFLKEKPDENFEEGETLPGGFKAINVPDNKSPGETALLLNEGKGILLIGDALIGWPEGEFSLLPRVKYIDPEKAKDSIRVLLDYNFDTVLVGDGESVLNGGKEAIRRFLNRGNVHLTLPVN